MASAVAMVVLVVASLALASDAIMFNGGRPFPKHNGAAKVIGDWVNEYDKDATVECQGNQTLSFLGSVFKGYYKDRRWQFRCKKAPGKVIGCHWTDFQNDFDQPLAFDCPGNQVLNGMFSTHNDHYEDRRFKLQCCRVDRRSTKGCTTTEDINVLQGMMNYTVPDKLYIKGVASVHHDNKEDRTWKLKLCKLV